jgi:Cep192 domain 4/Abnormal spindle-like microcephaly-assoc'd, ASPM-SPD-2-Hydin
MTHAPRLREICQVAGHGAATPNSPPCCLRARSRRSDVKHFGPPRTCVGCGLVLLSVFLLSATSAGQLVVNPSTVSFGSVQIGGSVSQSVVLSNALSSTLTISQATVSGTGFASSGLGMPTTLAPGQSVSLTTTFAPRSGGTVTGGLSLAYSFPKNKSRGKGSPNSNATATLSLTGTGTGPGQLTANPSSLNFANVQVGGSLILMDSLTNTGGAVVTILQAGVTGTGFGMSGLNVPLTLNPGASVTFSTIFAPQSPGSTSGSINVTSDASNTTLTVPLTGTGTNQGQVALTPVTLDFGNVTVGANASRTSSLSASGASVIVSSASVSSVEFSLTGISLPLTIAAGQSVPFTLTFAPQTSGTATAVLSITSSASNAPTETLGGNGVAPPPHGVSLSWGNSGSGTVGYNVYRGSASGGPYSKINSALDATAAYSDDSVVAGQTYYYVATAVDGSGMESTYSNEAQAVIPSP